MTDKKITPKDKQLNALLKDGGRPDATIDFNNILKRATKLKPSDSANKKTH